MRHVLAGLARSPDPRLIVGAETADDAGVCLVAPGLALVQTVDFITPIVDDPRAFGAIAAANSLSDVYAMGGKPLTALNIVCFPEKKLPIEVLGEILAGAQAKCDEAGCLVAGGHTVNDPELKFGLSVTGTVEPERVVRNCTARPGDVLVLTKPIGTGILATALKKGRLGEVETGELVRSMSALNAVAGEAMTRLGASAATDVTGFGLFGHAWEMAAGAGVAVVLDAGRFPLLPGARELARRGVRTGADRRNRDYVGGAFTARPDVAEELLALGFDAQTSGGMLVAFGPDVADRYLREVPGAVTVGRVEPGPARLVVVP